MAIADGAASQASAVRAREHCNYRVFRDAMTDSTPELMAPHRRQVPFELATHAEGGVGFSCWMEELRALQVVVLRVEVKAERYGAAHQLNWKNTGRIQ